MESSSSGNEIAKKQRRQYASDASVSIKKTVLLSDGQV